MAEPPDHLATRLANAAGEGDGDAAERLLPLVYEELRQLAHQRMAAEAPGTTLQPTAVGMVRAGTLFRRRRRDHAPDPGGARPPAPQPQAGRRSQKDRLRPGECGLRARAR
ncbi:MAG: ECF-type sigma factor [Planctomycetota bacterium]